MIMNYFLESPFPPTTSFPHTPSLLIAPVFTVTNKYILNKADESRTRKRGDAVFRQQ